MGVFLAEAPSRPSLSHAQHLSTLGAAFKQTRHINKPYIREFTYPHPTTKLTMGIPFPGRNHAALPVAGRLRFKTRGIGLRHKTSKKLLGIGKLHRQLEHPTLKKQRILVIAV